MKRFKLNIPLINTHTHAAMMAFRGLAEDMPLQDWLEKHIWPLEKERVNPKFVYEQTKLAIQEMKRNGIRAFSDMYFFEDEVAKAAEEEKIYVTIGEAILDFPTPSAREPKEALEIAEKQLEKYKNNLYVSVAVAPHSIYILSEEWLIKAKELARKYHAIFHIHLSETKKEVNDCAARHGVTPVEYANKLGLLDNKTILAHCVHITDNDVNIIAKTKASASHCPLSNLKLGSGIAPVAKMLEKGINVALGTDGPASSNRLDIWEAGKIADLLQKGMTSDPSATNAKTAIKMMSVNGMRALGMEKIDGKNITEIEKEIEDGNFNFLYEANAEEIDFSEIQ